MPSPPPPPLPPPLPAPLASLGASAFSVTSKLTLQGVTGLSGAAKAAIAAAVSSQLPIYLAANRNFSVSVAAVAASRRLLDATVLIIVTGTGTSADAAAVAEALSAPSTLSAVAAAAGASGAQATPPLVLPESSIALYAPPSLAPPAVPQAALAAMPVAPSGRKRRSRADIIIGSTVSAVAAVTVCVTAAVLVCARQRRRWRLVEQSNGHLRSIAPTPPLAVPAPSTFKKGTMESVKIVKATEH